MNLKAFGVASCALATLLCIRVSAQTIAPLRFTRFELPNGLVALVNEDHSSPLVAVDVWYHVGAKDEALGHTGLAHLCEHLMGEGSPNEPIPEKVFLQSIGGTSAHWGVTSEDITHYFATVPSNELETMLWLESDRMAAPLTRADSAHLGPVRTVIAQERLQNRESPVYGFADGLTVRLLFPDKHPYGIDPLGPMTDLETATAEDAKQFCLPYYVPNNAIVSLSGDVRTVDAKRLIQKYFGGIPRGANPPSVVVPSHALAVPERAVLEDARARVPQLRIVWPTVAFAHEDKVALNALASVLSRDRVGRLTKLLVYDLGIASRVTAGNYDYERGGLFQIEIVPRANTSLTRLEQLTDSVMTDLQTHPPTSTELDAFARSNAVLAIITLQTRAARADTLAHGEIFAHDPVVYAKQVDKAFTVTSAQVVQVAERYLTSVRLVMSMVPAGKLELISKPELPFANVTPRTSRGAP